MEKIKQPELTLDEKFDQLPIGGLIKLPISKVNTTDVDDGKISMTDGPIEVYKNESNKIFIYDGNHRYFDKERDLIKRLGFDHRDDEPVEFKKVKNERPW